VHGVVAVTDHALASGVNVMVEGRASLGIVAAIHRALGRFQQCRLGPAVSKWPVGNGFDLWLLLSCFKENAAMNNWNRREFLLAAGVGTGAAFVAVHARRQVFAGGQPAVRVRKEVNTLTPIEIGDYRNAVKILKDRTANNTNNPKGWRSLALIHQNYCPHGNWFFFPWHRAYLDYFEQICREALPVGNSFTLPYWDWSKNPYLPAEFWGQDNPLNDPTRELDPNDPIPPEYVGANVMDNILSIQDFETFASGKAMAQRPTMSPFGFSGQLESIPHNNVHGYISGNMGAFMSPLDPIFWLHHANIDRLWNEWVRRHPAGTTQDGDWRDFEVGTFVDLQGNNAKRKVSDLLDTHQLGYRYDTDPAEATPVAFGAPPTIPMELTASAKPMAFASAVMPLSQGVKVSQQFTDLATTAAKAEKRAKTIRLIIRDIPVPENQRFSVRVFLNCKDPNARTPIGDPTYVGSFSFFSHAQGVGAGHGGMEPDAGTPAKATFCFDISDVVRRLERAGQYKAEGEFKVSLVPVPLKKGQAVSAELKPGQIEFVGLK
jgi:tyrosinase